jgi:hypothetical protein
VLAIERSGAMAYTSSTNYLATHYLPNLVSFDRRSHSRTKNLSIRAIVKECATRIESKLFSIDIIDRQHGVQRVVEIGDGQVSGLVG